MRVLKHVYLEIKYKDEKKEMIECNDKDFYVKIDNDVVKCKLHIIKSGIEYYESYKTKIFEVYIVYTHNEEKMYKKVSCEDIENGYKEKGIDVEAHIRSDYFILEDSFNMPPNTIIPGDNCFLSDITYPHKYYDNVYYNSTLNAYKCKYLGANEEVAKFIMLEGDIPIDVHYKDDDRYLVMK